LPKIFIDDNIIDRIKSLVLNSEAYHIPFKETARFT